MIKTIAAFAQKESAGGLCLIVAALVALILANTPLAEMHDDFFAAPVRIGLTFRTVFYGLEETMTQWINDALMALFFLLLGLEIKREVLTGELSALSLALQPVFAVICGMAAPIMLYYAIHHGNPGLLRGWAVPVSTDIAFALAVLTLVGPRVPPAMKIALTAIAVLDDLMAILIIAAFYSGSLHFAYLIVAGIGVAGLAALNRFRTGALGGYLAFGLLVWIGFMKAGIHPTLAGVITALFVPLRIGNEETSPAGRLETMLHPVVVFGILPLFTLANAGVSLAGLTLRDVAAPLTLSVVLCLCIAKPLGVMGGLLIGQASGLARKPVATPWRHYFGIAILCGMGFTMPLFLAKVAFSEQATINQIKLGVLSACLLSGGIGWSVCRFIFKRKDKT